MLGGWVFCHDVPISEYHSKKCLARVVNVFCHRPFLVGKYSKFNLFEPLLVGYWFFHSYWVLLFFMFIRLSISISKQLRCQLSYQHFGYNNRPLCIKLGYQIIGLNLIFFKFLFCIIYMFNILGLITYLDDNMVIQVVY
jgi:uncharacterized membrane protein